MPSSTKPRVRLRVENFGPIVEGEVEFKPLTLFIGPNNSGKSYLALLYYALAKAFDGSTWQSVVDSPLPPEILDELSPRLVQPRGPIILDELPPHLAQLVDDLYAQHLNDIGLELREFVQQYLDVNDLSALGRAGDQSSGWNLTVSDNFHLSTFVTTSTFEAIPMFHVWNDTNGNSIAIDIEDFPFLRERHSQIPQDIINQLWLTQVHSRGFRTVARYLPPARSGILVSWPLIASQAVRRLGRARPQIDDATYGLPGVVSDFLETAISEVFTSNGKERLGDSRSWNKSVLEILEQRMLQGRIDAGGAESFSVRLDYVSDSGSIPVQRASSMVAELAPLDLWVRKVLAPGDLLIIDEPEAHLHPANQRLVAQTLVRLVNAGVDVVAPTHSATILQQVSNLLIASELDDKVRSRMGFAEADRIAYDDVAVYLFEVREDGTYIRPVEIERGFGISEEEFWRAAEALGDETYRLSFAAAQQPV